MYKLIVNRFFDASHQLPDSEDLVTKACAQYHGHTYLARVTFESEKNDRHGMVVDFKAIKNVIDLLDHRFINDIFSKYPEFLGVPPTAENIARFIHTEIRNQISGLVDLKVGICEGYKGEEASSWSYYED